MYLKVKVKANSKREELVKISENTFEISVREKAERNMANNRVLEILSFELKIPINKIRIINGHQSPTKLISISD